MDWVLKNMPPYTGGHIEPMPYRCGTGMEDDYEKTDCAEDCTMQVVRGTDAQAFLAYCDVLCADGFEKLYERDEKSSLYRQYKKGDELVYLYFTPCNQTAHIIEDAASVTPDVFSKDDAPEKWDNTKLMQFGLYYDEMIKGTTCDCGMNYVIRLRNNKLIILDGGEKEQVTKASMAEFWRRVREMTGTQEDAPIDVALWYCTHPHDDHMDFFLKLLEYYGDLVRVERVMFNFPSYVVFEYEKYVQSMRRILSSYCPDVRFLKCHTGQKFSVGNAEIDILYTHEDLYDGTEESVDYGTNTFSTVLTITCDDTTTLFLADADNRVGEILCERYDEIPCKFVQAAHHCINRVEHIYALVKSEYVLVPAGRYITDKHNGENYDVLCKYYNHRKILLAGDYTNIFTLHNGEMKMAYYPIRGNAYEGM